MLNIGGLELLVILLVALVFLGPERLPEAARQAGQTVNSLRDLARGFQTELEAAARPDSLTGAAPANSTTVDDNGISSDPFDLAAKARAKSVALAEDDDGDEDAAGNAIRPVDAGGPSDLRSVAGDEEE